MQTESKQDACVFNDGHATNVITEEVTVTDDKQSSGSERRVHERFETSIAVDYASGDTFLFAYLQNISEMGIFLGTDNPLSVGTRLRLRFQTEESAEPMTLEGEVTWINPVREGGDNLNPGMGLRFVGLTAERREEVVALVRTVAYLRKDEIPGQTEA